MKSEIFGGRWDFSLEKGEVSAKLGNFGGFLRGKCGLLYKIWREIGDNFGMMGILLGFGVEMGNLVARLVNFGEL